MPTGDILWRVDDRPFRTLKAADNPVASPRADAPTDLAAKAMQDAVTLTAKFTATSTVASGGLAKEMLVEKLSGNGLIFRSAAVAPAYGLGFPNGYEVGQITKDGLRPYPLDSSSREALAMCSLVAEGS